MVAEEEVSRCRTSHVRTRRFIGQLQALRRYSPGHPKRSIRLNLNNNDHGAFTSAMDTSNVKDARRNL